MNCEPVLNSCRRNWDCSQIVSGYGIVSFVPRHGSLDIYVTNCDSKIFIPAESYHQVLSRDHLLNLLCQGDHLAFTARPTDVSSCDYTSDCWARKEEVVQGEGKVYRIDSVQGYIVSEKHGRIYFPVRSYTDLPLEPEPDFGKYFQDGNKVTYRAIPQKATNGYEWRAIEVSVRKPGDSLFPRAEDTKRKAEHLSPQMEPSVFSQAVRHKIRRNNAYGENAMSIANLTNDLDSSFKTVLEDVCGFVACLTEDQAILWAYQCGFVKYFPTKFLKTAEIFPMLEVGNWLRFAVKTTGRISDGQANAVDIKQIDDSFVNSFEVTGYGPDFCKVNGIAEIVVIHQKEVYLWCEWLGLLNCPKSGSVVSMKLGDQLKFIAECSFNGENGDLEIYTPWIVKKIKRIGAEDLMTFPSLKQRKAVVRSVRGNSAVLMLQDIEENALFSGLEFEEALERGILFRKTVLTVVAVHVPKKTPDSFSYRCLRVFPDNRSPLPLASSKLHADACLEGEELRRIDGRASVPVLQLQSGSTESLSGFSSRKRPASLPDKSYENEPSIIGAIPGSNRVSRTRPQSRGTVASRLTAQNVMDDAMSGDSVLCDLAKRLVKVITEDDDIFVLFIEKEPELIRRIQYLKKDNLV